jgi:hypothetical protein
MEIPCKTCVVYAICFNRAESFIWPNGNLDKLSKECYKLEEYFPYKEYYFSSHHQGDGVIAPEECTISWDEWERRRKEVREVLFGIFEDNIILENYNSHNQKILLIEKRTILRMIYSIYWPINRFFYHLFWNWKMWFSS